jgi:hypothetical protein
VDEEEKKSERLHLHPNADLADDDSSAAMREAAALPLFPQVYTTPFDPNLLQRQRKQETCHYE